jgi:lysyl-tRNA synthetase class I
MITTDLDSIVTKQARSISVGLRPSGTVHLGNLTTIAIAGLLAGKMNAEMHLTVCDIDMPTVKRGEQTPSAVYFKYQEVDNSTRAQLGAVSIGHFTRELSRSLGIPIRTDFLSDVQAMQPYRTGLSRIIANTAELQSIFTGIEDNADKRVPVHPVCGSCNHTPRAQAIYLGQRALKTRCRNEKCDEYNNKKVIDISDRRVELGVHYFIDPMRDVMLTPRADIHVFGGDYLTPHGQNGLPKVEKVRRVTELTGKKAPSYFVGPLLQGPELEKISKSQAPVLTYDQMRSNHESSQPFALYVAHFAEKILRSGNTHVPYAFITEFFKTTPQETAVLSNSS